jgi:hypothetical protein
MNRKRDFFVPQFAYHLEEHQEYFKLLPPNNLGKDLSGEWLEINFPTILGRVDWKNVPGSYCLRWQSFSDLMSLFQTIINEECLEGEVIIMWLNILRIPLFLDLGILVKYGEEALDEDSNTWIMSQELGWCLEVYHEGEICFGYSPNYLEK